VDNFVNKHKETTHQK